MPRKLENWLTAYAKYTSASEAPEMFNFWSGVSAIAGAMQKKCCIDQVRFRWTPNFYIIFVAPPGVATKSTTISVAMNLLKQVDGIQMGPQSLTWQGLTSGLQKSLQLIPMGGLTGDLLDQNYMSQSAITCELSELGTMLDARDTALVSVLIDLWDGRDGTWERWLRSSENTKIENPWINIIAATTPSWLRGNFTEEMIFGGLTSRVVFAYADKKQYLIPYINQLVDATDHLELEKALVHDLNEINLLRGDFIMTPAALEFGGNWYRQHWQNVDEHLRNPKFHGYNARKQTHMHKLAMILSAAESDGLIIDKRHLEISLALLAGVERDMHIVFDSIGMVQSARDMEFIKEILKTQGIVTDKNLWGECYRFMTRMDFQAATDACVKAGWTMIFVEQGTTFYKYIPELDDDAPPTVLTEAVPKVQ